MNRLKQLLTAAIFAALLFPLSEIHAQDAAVPAADAPKPVAVATETGLGATPAAVPTTDKAEGESGAQNGVDGVAAPAADAASTDGAAEPETTPEDLLKGVAKTVDDWRTLGWLAGLVALLNLLMGLLRFKPLDVWMKQREVKWLKPYIAMGLGALIMGFSTYATGAGVLNSVVAGILAGLGSVGAHEAFTGKIKFGPKAGA